MRGERRWGRDRDLDCGLATWREAMMMVMMVILVVIMVKMVVVAMRMVVDVK